MTDLFGNNTIPETKEEHRKRIRREQRNADGSWKINPMVLWYGSVNGGQTCRDCIYLCVREFAKRYYKCRLRKCSSSPTTDHRVNWPACSKFELKEYD